MVGWVQGLSGECGLVVCEKEEAVRTKVRPCCARMIDIASKQRYCGWYGGGGGGGVAAAPCSSEQATNGEGIDSRTW